MFLFIPLAGILKIIFERVDGFKPWAILMGTEEDAEMDRPKTAETPVQLAENEADRQGSATDQ